MQALAVQSVEFGDRIMILTSGRVYSFHGTDVVDGVVTATLHEETESAVGANVTVPVSQIIG